MADIQKTLQTLSDEYSKLQTELQSTIDARQKLESQHQENKGVAREFSLFSPENNKQQQRQQQGGGAGAGKIYKLVGPVLLTQDKSEAILAVQARLEFIEKEIKRVEKQIKELQVKSENTKMQVYQIQSQMQAQK